MIDALPPPEIVAHLHGPREGCVVSLEYSDDEAGNITSTRCGARRYVIARHNHGAGARKISRCATMLMIDGVRFPRLFHVDNCRGPLVVRDIGNVWTRDLMTFATITRSQLDRVMYYPVAGRPTCYRISIAFTPPGKRTNTPLDERSAMRCESGHDRSRRSSRP